MTTPERSYLLEWLSKIPPLPWQSAAEAGVVCGRSLVVVLKGNHYVGPEMAQAIANYTAHACTQFPLLLEAAEKYLASTERPSARKAIDPWTIELFEAIQNAKALAPDPTGTEAEDLEDAQMEILRLQGQMTEIRTAAKRFLDTAEKKGVFGEEAKNLLASIAGTTKPTPPDPLTCFINTVASTGGVVRNPDGTYSPMVDPEWLDLADCYLAACAARRVKPIIVETAEAEAKKGEA